MQRIAIILGWVASLGVGWSPGVAADLGNALGHVEGLNRAVCRLHTEFDQHGAGSYATQAVCRLESATELLLANLRRRDAAATDHALHEVDLWFERTSVAFEADHRLHAEHHVVSKFNEVARSYARARNEVECWLVHPGPQHFDSRYRPAYPQDPVWLGSQVSPDYRFEQRPSQHGQFDYRGGFESRGPTSRREWGVRGFPSAGSSLSPAWPIESRFPPPAFAPRGPAAQPNGEVGRAILGAVLSELLK